jgi:Rod binding domain-containing protein
MGNMEILLGGSQGNLHLEQLRQKVDAVDAVKAKGVNDSDERCKDLCKGFESVLIEKMLDEMKNTVGQWGEEEDAVTGQVMGIFSFYMADHLAESGGFGMWKDVYKSLGGDLAELNESQQLDGEI